MAFNLTNIDAQQSGGGLACSVLLPFVRIKFDFHNLTQTMNVNFDIEWAPKKQKKSDKRTNEEKNRIFSQFSFLIRWKKFARFAIRRSFISSIEANCRRTLFATFKSQSVMNCWQMIKNKNSNSKQKRKRFHCFRFEFEMALNNSRVYSRAGSYSRETPHPLLYLTHSLAQSLSSASVDALTFSHLATEMKINRRKFRYYFGLIHFSLSSFCLIFLSFAIFLFLRRLFLFSSSLIASPN